MLARRLACTLVAGAALFSSGEAEAQYRNFTFGFEGGYMLFTRDTGLKQNNFGLGMFGGYKAADHWWFYAKALLSFPGQLDNAPNTVVLLHFVPASVRYYFQTDAFRPYVGLTNSFQFFANTSDPFAEFYPGVLWGPGASAGFELKLRRDLFLGIEADAYWMFNFQGPDSQLVSATAQVIFFL